jgi:hypothetical protein
MSPAEPPGYLGRVLNGTGEPVGTCFQVAPRILVTAWHVLRDVGADVERACVMVDPLNADDDPVAAMVLRVDAACDLAVLRRDRPLASSVVGLAASARVARGTGVGVVGVSNFVDSHGYLWTPAPGSWLGLAMRNDRVAFGQMDAKHVVRGMSGAPVRLAHGDAVVGVVSSRYHSVDGYQRDAVWVARTEDLAPLLAGIVPDADRSLGQPCSHRAPNRRDRPDRPRDDDSLVDGMPLWLAGLLVLCVGLAGATAWIGARYGDASAGMIASPVAVSLILCLGGTLAWWLHRASRRGAWMTALGVSILLATLNAGLQLPSDLPFRELTVLVGMPAFWVVVPIAIRLFLGSPTSGVEDAAERSLITRAFVCAGVASVATLVTKTDVPVCNNWCGPSPVQLFDNLQLYLVTRSVFLIAMAVFGVHAVVLLARRFARSSPAGKRMSRPVLIVATVLAAVHVAEKLGWIAFYFGQVTRTGSVDQINLVLGWMMAATLPLGLLGLLLARLHTRVKVLILFRRLEDLTLDDVEVAVATILNDPTFRIVSQTGDGWHDARGRPTGDDVGAARTRVTDDPRTVKLAYDPAYAEHTPLLDDIARLVRQVLERSGPHGPAACILCGLTDPGGPDTVRARAAA